MNWSPFSHPDLWQPLAIVLLTGFLGWYSWRRRQELGALPFAIACALSVLWAVGSFAEKASSEPGLQIGWFVFKAIWLLPIVCAISSFVVQYAGLGRWLTRGTVLGAFVLPSVVFGTLIATNAVHRLMAQGPFVEGEVVHSGPLGVAGWAFAAYHALLALFNIAVLVRLYVLSPARRRPVGLIIVGHVIARVGYAFEVYGHLPFVTSDPEVAGVGIPFVLYAVALFGFRVFDPVPQARAAAVEHMRDAMVVLDPQGRIVYANPPGELLLGGPLSDVQGRPAHELLPRGATALAGESASSGSFRTGQGEAARDYAVTSTALTDRVGHPLGRMLLVRDVTDEHRAQAYLLDRERAHAALREREHLARELHDSVGQVLGYVSMQTQAAHKWLQAGDVPRASALLNRLTEVAQEAHDDTRESILALKAAPAAGWSFLSALRAYAQDFERQYGIAVAVTTGEGVSAEPFEPGTGVQVLRVIQEAMSNARRHGGARVIDIDIEHVGDNARITVSDDGRGMSARTSPGPTQGHFGITFMRERIAEVGGSMSMWSQEGEGTRITLTIPVNSLEAL